MCLSYSVYCQASDVVANLMGEKSHVNAALNLYFSYYKGFLYNFSCLKIVFILLCKLYKLCKLSFIHFLKQNSWSFFLQLRNIFACEGYQPSTLDILCKYFLLVCCLSFSFVYGILPRKTFYFIQLNLINFSFFMVGFLILIRKAFPKFSL